jgi:two-component system, response regulator PdtaR
VSGKGKILIVDDDRLVLATLTHGLSQAGYDTINADNGDDAILLARQQQPELALLDIRMEGKSGFDVAQYLRDVCNIPFMFLSAFSDDATVAKVKELGAVAYLIKPLDIRQIVPAVENAFEVARQRQDSSFGQLAASCNPLEHTVAIAVGVVMHRYSISRSQALDRLRRLARTENRALDETARRLVDATERLSLPQ